MEVRIYPRASERGRKAGFFVADYSTGKRRMRWFTDEKKARAEGTRIAALMNAGDAVGASMTGDDRREMLRATELVAPFKLDLPTACALFAEAARLVGPHAVVEAAKAFAKRSPASREQIPLASAVAGYIEHKAAKRRSARLLGDLKSRLGRFVEEHPGAAVGDFTAEQIQRWLDRLTVKHDQPASPVTRRNYGTIVGGLFEYLRRRGQIAENPCRDLEREKISAEGDVEFWTPSEARALLEAAGARVKPALVLALFTGLRTAELARLRWADVDLRARHVSVGADRAKTRSRRLAPIPENAAEWLALLAGSPEDPIFPGHVDGLPKEVSQAAQDAGVRRIANGARHSWFTYTIARSGDVARAALDGGNSATVVFQHYRGLADRSQAEEFFSIRPLAEGGAR